MEHFVRRLPTTAPPLTSFRDDKPCLLISWWCTLYSLAIILFRAIGRYIRTGKIFLDDQIMLLAVVPLIARMIFENYVIYYGTNNVDITYITGPEIKSRELGSKMVLISRVLYAVFLWTIKYSMSIFLRTLTAPIWKRLHQIHLRYLHCFLLLTLLMTFAATLMPCQPFNHFWQVVPDPGSFCRQNYFQLFTTGGLNIITNIVLVIFPFPIVLMSGLPMSQKSTILFRLSLPLLPIFLTLYAIPYLTSSQPASSSQISRTLFISLDILLTTFSSNAVVLFSLLQDKGYKKSKFKHVRELLDVKRPVHLPCASYRSFSIDETCTHGAGVVELNDVGGLLRNVNAIEDGLKSQNGLKTNGSKTNSPQGPTETLQADSYQDSSIVISPSCRQIQKESQEWRARSETDIQTSIGTSLGDERCWGRKSNICVGAVDILPPPPVRFGDVRIAHTWEVYIEEDNTQTMECRV